MTSVASTALVAAALSFRLSADQVVLREGQQGAILVPVHSNGEDDPNKSYSKFTPQAKFEFLLTNPTAFGFLQPGVVYDIVMVPTNGPDAIQVVPKLAKTGDDTGQPAQTGQTDPAPSDPAPVDPAPVDPAASTAAATDPAATGAAAADPATSTTATDPAAPAAAAITAADPATPQA